MHTQTHIHTIFDQFDLWFIGDGVINENVCSLEWAPRVFHWRYFGVRRTLFIMIKQFMVQHMEINSDIPGE